MVKKIKLYSNGNSPQWKVALMIINEYEEFIRRSGSRLDKPSSQSVLDLFDGIELQKSKKRTISRMFKSNIDERAFGYLLCRRYQLLIALSMIPRLKVKYLKECEEQNTIPVEIKKCISSFRDMSMNSTVYRFKYIKCINDVKEKDEEIERLVNFLIESNISSDMDRWSDKQIIHFLHLSVLISTNEETTMSFDINDNNVDSLSSFIDSHKSRAFEMWLSVKASNPDSRHMLRTRIPLFQALAFTYTMLQPFYIGESKNPQFDKDMFEIMNIFSNYVPSNCRLDGFMNSKLIKSLLK